MPCIILSIFNILFMIYIFKRLKYSSRIASTRRKKLSTNKTIIVLTILFVVFTTPSAIISRYYNDLVNTKVGNIILLSGDCFSFTFHALSIFVLYLSNKRFSDRLKPIIFIDFRVIFASRTKKSPTLL